MVLGLLLVTHGNAQLVLAGWTFPNPGADALVDISTPANSTETISVVGATLGEFTFVGVPPGSYCAYATNWNSGANSKHWQIRFNTTGYYNLTISSKQRSSNTGPRNFKIQYRIGAAGVWTDVPDATAIVVDNSSGFTSGTVNAVPLPVACENEAAVFLRWIMTTNTAVDNDPVQAAGSSRIDEIYVIANSQDHFRTRASGSWHDASTWETSPNGLDPWNLTSFTPTNVAQTITIRDTHTVTLSADATMDQLTIEVGGTLNYTGGTQDIRDGAGVDMQVNGTFINAAANSTDWDPDATWALGGGATFVKSSDNSSNDWRDHYNGGIANIAETANWIIRKISGTNPTLSSTDGMVYPNLIIENNTAGNWNAGGVGSFITGTTLGPVILGNLDIGGAGSSTVTFYNGNTFAQLPVLGDIIVRSGNTLNLGSASVGCAGFTVDGDILCNGTITYGTSGTRRITMREGNPQTISGSGTFNAYDLTIDKLVDDVTLGMSITVNNVLDLVDGRILNDATAHVVRLNAGASATNATDASFVTGRVRKLGNTAFSFPVGKGGNIQRIAIGAGGAASDSFVAEYFQVDPDPEPDDVITPPLDHISACEYWNLEREVSSANRTVTLTWDVNSCGVTALSDLRVAHFDATAATPAWFDRGNTATTGDENAGTVTSGPNALFGPFTLSSTSSENPLPITLLSFTGRAMDNDAILLWTTASEQDNAYFELLASGPDRGVWEELLPIGRVAGAGTSWAPLDYRFVDQRPDKRGTYYYQLRQVDFDGTATLSQVITLEFGKGGLADPVVWPNPFSTDATVLLDAPAPGTLQVQLRNALGQTIGSTSFAIEQGRFSFPLGDLAPVAQGVYYLELSIGEFRTLTRVVRQ